MHLAFSRLEAAVSTWLHFLFTPQEASELPPAPRPPLQGRDPRALACCPGPAADPQTAPPLEAEWGGRGGGPGRLPFPSSGRKGLSRKGLGNEVGVWVWTKAGGL